MMNNEEIERKMNFIVEQQAQFASDIQLLQESQAQTAETVAQMGDVVTRLATVTHAGFTEVNAKINALVDAQIRTEANLERLEVNVERHEANFERLEANVERHEANFERIEANFERLEANIERTDKNLNNLTTVVDRFLRDRRNGK